MFSCEKNSIEKVVTVEEMKKIVSESIEINNIFKINNVLIMIAKQRAIKISNNDQKISSSINQNSNLGNDIKQAKTRDDLRIILNKLNPTNGDLILEKLEKQQILFKEFLAKNPEFLQFTNNEKIEILTIIQRNYNKNSLNTTLSQFSNPVNQGIKTFNCLDDFQGHWNACQSSYDSSVFNIYVGVITTMGGRSGLGNNRNNRWYSSIGLCL